MWSLLKDEEQGERRVNERIKDKDFWGPMIAKGARVIKHDDTPESAIKIVKMLYSKPKGELLMQTELNKNGGSLLKTSAGIVCRLVVLFVV